MLAGSGVWGAWAESWIYVTPGETEDIAVLEVGSKDAPGAGRLIVQRRDVTDSEPLAQDEDGGKVWPVILTEIDPKSKSEESRLKVLAAVRDHHKAADQPVTIKQLEAKTDFSRRTIVARLPELDERTLLILQAGEVNTGEFDRFAELIAIAREANAWVHVDGAFGLWARASSSAHLLEGVELADSWTTDGHKWLNTPHDSAMAICRDADALAAAMNSDAAYASASKDAQKNLTLEFSRRARGIAIWAALANLGRTGLQAMIDRHIRQAEELANTLRNAGYQVLNRVVLNQVLVRGDPDEQTIAIRQAAQASGEVWFGPTVWQGRPAFRLSLCSWRTEDADVEALGALLLRLKDELS